MTTITIDSQAVTQALNQLSQRVTNMQPAMSEIGESIVSWVDLTFRDAEDPYGNPWAELSPVTISKRINRSSKPLNDTGILKSSITKKPFPYEVIVGTNVKYAPTHQFGATKGQYATGVPWGNIPARPFFPTEEKGFPDTWEQDILNIIRHHLESGI